MTLTYIGTSGLFTHLGKLVKHYNQFKTDATDAATGLDADRLDILDTFQAADQDLPIDGLVSAFERWKAEYVGRREELAGFALARLRDPASVLKEIGASSTDQNEILFKLVNQMIEDGQTVEASEVSIGSVSVGGSNKGGGTILTTDVLDGVTSPGSVNGASMPAHPAYDGWQTELAAPSETFHFRVSADSFQDDVDEGSEEIAWEGQVPDEQHGIGTEGSGFVGTIQPVHAVTDEYLSNADFENFTGDAPDDWDVEADGGQRHIDQAEAGRCQDGGGGPEAVLRDRQGEAGRGDDGHVDDPLRGKRLHGGVRRTDRRGRVRAGDQLPTGPLLREHAGDHPGRFPVGHPVERGDAGGVGARVPRRPGSGAGELRGRDRGGGGAGQRAFRSGGQLRTDRPEHRSHLPGLLPTSPRNATPLVRSNGQLQQLE
jgi:hypothetical protein